MWSRNVAPSGRQPENRQRTQERERQEQSRKKEADDLYKNFKHEVRTIPRFGPELTQERKEQAMREIRRDERKQQDKRDTQLYEKFIGEVNAMPRLSRNSD